MLPTENDKILALLCSCQAENIALAETIAESLGVNISALLAKSLLLDLGIEKPANFQTKLLSGDFMGNLYSKPLKSLQAMKYFAHLTDLNCAASKKLTKLKGIEYLTELLVLNCENCNLKSLEGIENALKLRQLNCHYNKINSLKGLENCTQIAHLDCSRNKLANLAGLENCVQLKVLDCHQNQLIDISALYQLPRLEVLHIHENFILEHNQIVSFRQYQPHCKLILTFEEHLKHKFSGV